MENGKKRVLSGIQPTGQIHIGNYLGAVKQWVRFQDEYDCVFSIVDMHAITVPPYDPLKLKQNIRELAAILIACGIDPAKSILFVQSDVPEHAELAWMLNCVTPLGWLQRMTQFKEKSDKHKDNSSAGLFTYPALQAADILLYDTDLVPVGEDQTQHVEITRDIAQRFNSLFGETFKLPSYFTPGSETQIPSLDPTKLMGRIENSLKEESKIGRVMGLDDPTKKMSKSDEHTNHAIYILDEPDVIRRKIKRAKTDSIELIELNPARKELYNLLLIYLSFDKSFKDDFLNKKTELFDIARKYVDMRYNDDNSPNESPEIERQKDKVTAKMKEVDDFPEKYVDEKFKGKRFKELKEELGELIVNEFAKIQKDYKEIKRDKKYLQGVLYEGAQRAREICVPILKKAKKSMGLGK